MPYTECAECSRPTGVTSAAGECATLHRCTLKKRIAPLCCECANTGIRKGKISKPAAEAWKWCDQACRNCKLRKSAKCGGVFQKKTFSQQCVCGLLEADHLGLPAVFATIRSTGSASQEDDESGEAPTQPTRSIPRMAASFMSPSRERPEGTNSMTGRASPPPRLLTRAQDGSTSRDGTVSYEIPLPDETRENDDNVSRDDVSARSLEDEEASGCTSQTSSSGHQKRLDDALHTGFKVPKKLRNPFSMFGFGKGSSATPLEADDEDAAGGNGQLLPEEAEMLRRELEIAQRHMQEHEGELAEITEQKKGLEQQLEATVKHVVNVMSEDKRRLNLRIQALEQEKAMLVTNGRKLQALVEDLRSDLKNKQGTLTTVKSRLQSTETYAKKTKGVFRQVGEESDVESASSNSSKDICIANTARIEEKLTKILAASTSRDELGEQVLEAAGRLSHLSHSNILMQKQLSKTDDRIQEMEHNKEELAVDAAGLQQCVNVLEAQLANALSDRDFHRQRATELEQRMNRLDADTQEKNSAASTSGLSLAQTVTDGFDKPSHWSVQPSGIRVLRPLVPGQAASHLSVPTEHQPSGTWTDTAPPMPSLPQKPFPEIKVEDVEILDRIAEGTFGVVYKARWLSAIVAIKKLRPPTGALTTQEVDAFSQDYRREVQQLMRLRHPNILSFYGSISEVGELAIVTELMEGDMRGYLKTRAKSESLSKRVNILRSAACGIRYLHGESLVHRDIKPENFLLMHLQKGTLVKVCDFGLCRIKDATMVNTNHLGGTMMYIAPEVHRGEHFDERSDVYSFSVVMWELVTKEPPFADKPLASIPGIVGWGQQRPSTELLHSALSGSVLSEQAHAMRGCDRGMGPDILRSITESWAHEPTARLSIGEVVSGLDRALLAAGDSPDLHLPPAASSPAREPTSPGMCMMGEFPPQYPTIVSQPAQPLKATK